MCTGSADRRYRDGGRRQYVTGQTAQQQPKFVRRTCQTLDGQLLFDPHDNAEAVLISGAGIAGPSLAFWLTRNGYRVTIVELADGIRPGGQTVDLRGAGGDVVERMGLIDQMRESLAGPDAASRGSRPTAAGGPRCR